MPRRVGSMMALIAAVAVFLAAFLATGRWYTALDEADRVSVDVARTILVIVSIFFAAILVPLVTIDWFRDRLRERRSGSWGR